MGATLNLKIWHKKRSIWGVVFWDVKKKAWKYDIKEKYLGTFILRPGKKLLKCGIKKKYLGRCILRLGKKVLKYSIKKKYLWDLYFETWRKSLEIWHQREMFWGPVFWDVERKKRNLLDTCILRPGRKKERKSLEIWH